MPFEGWSDLRHLLVLAADDPEAVQPAVATLQQALPQANVTVMGCTPAWTATPQSGSILPSLDADAPPEALFAAVECLKQPAFDAAIILTPPGQSPFTLAYLCYLAGVPVRIGHSREFGGKVLSHSVDPPEKAPAGARVESAGAGAIAPPNVHLHLLQSAGLPPPLAATPTT